MTPRHMIAKLNKAGVTQEKIAKKTGTSQATISRIRNGVNLDPRASVVRVIRAMYVKQFGAKAE